MSTQTSYSDAGLWWHWLIATAAGLGLGLFLLMPALQIQLPFLSGSNLSESLAMGLVGFFQMLIIRPHLKTWRVWTLATVGGWIGFLTFSYSMGSGYFPPLSFFFARSSYPYGLFITGNLVTGIALGTIVGICQWLCLLLGKIKNASWWIAISAIAYAVALPIPAQFGFLGLFTNFNPSNTNQALITGMAGVFCGVGVGAISGLGMVWLLRHPISIEPPSAED